MYIKEILVDNFRILANKKYEFDKNFNLIYGKNAQGKTSLIEAVYFLASGKSFRTKKLIEQINEKENMLVVFSNIEDEKYAVKLTKDKRIFFKNSEKVPYKDYLGNILVVSISPEDIDLIMGSPDYRRRFFNYEISQIDKEYLNILLDFQKVLKNRNKLIKLKNIKTYEFEAYNEKYIELSIKLYLKRKKYIEKISKILNEKYKSLFGNKKELKLEYESFFNFSDDDYINLVKQFKNILKNKLDREIFYGFSILGPHKDDFSFILEDKKSKSFSSQGEKKSIILALKLSQADYIKKITNKNPIYLFDDISSYFDEVRKYKVLEYLKSNGSQCFFTSTEKIDISAKYIEIENGDIK